MNVGKQLRVQPPEAELSAVYWQGCREGELRLQQCDSCQGHQFYPRTICSHCGGTALSWRRVTGRGRVASFTVVRRALSSAYTVPYVLALIDLQEGPRMMSIIRAAPESVAVGAPVTVQFECWGAEHVLPVFSLNDGPEE